MKMPRELTPEKQALLRQQIIKTAQECAERYRFVAEHFDNLAEDDMTLDMLKQTTHGLLAIQEEASTSVSIKNRIIQLQEMFEAVRALREIMGDDFDREDISSADEVPMTSVMDFLNRGSKGTPDA